MFNAGQTFLSCIALDINMLFCSWTLNSALITRLHNNSFLFNLESLFYFFFILWSLDHPHIPPSIVKFIYYGIEINSFIGRKNHSLLFDGFSSENNII